MPYGSSSASGIEAHRFAITFHRSRRRDKAMTASVLDGVRGVGPARARSATAFRLPGGSLGASRRSSRRCPGAQRKLAREIHRQLQSGLSKRWKRLWTETAPGQATSGSSSW